MVLTTAHADFISFITPGPWSIGISLVRWLNEGPEKILYVEVVGEGDTIDQARQQGFRLAVEHLVGTVVASETEVRSDRVKRDEIITYASGYVDKFETISQQEFNNRIQIKMKVWVKPNKLANRLLNKSDTAGTIDGGRISTQIQSIQQERKSGDRLLKSVLADFPKRAFNVELDNTKVLFDANRNGQLEVAFYLSWSTHYLDSISEAITAINHRPDCGGFSFAVKCTSVQSGVSVVRPGFGSSTEALFDDHVAENMIEKEMVRSNPRIKISILDTAGNIQFNSCFSAPELDHSSIARGYYLEHLPNKVVINGKANKRFNTFINLSSVPAGQLDRVEIAIVRGSECQI